MKRNINKWICFLLTVLIILSMGALSVLADGVKYAVVANSTKSVSAGFYNAAAIKNDGTVWTWGFNEKGALGDGTRTSKNTPAQVAGIAQVKSVDIDLFNTVAVTESGELYVMGDSSFGQYGATVSTTTPRKIAGLSDIVEAVTARYYYESAGVMCVEPYILALDIRGDVYAWGGNKTGMLATGGYSDTPQSAPTKIAGLSDIASISACGSRALALRRDGTVYQWGYIGEDFYYYDKGRENYVYTPVKVAGLSGIRAISSGSHALALAEDGTVYGWGNSDYKQLCTDVSSTAPRVLTELSGLNVTEIFAENGYSLFRTADEKLYGAGNCCNLFADVDYDAPSYPVEIAAPNAFVRVALGGTFLVAETDDSSMMVWGEGTSFGAFGAGNTVLRSKTPVSGGISDVRKNDEYRVSSSNGNYLKIGSASMKNSSKVEISAPQSRTVISTHLYNVAAKAENRVTVVASAYKQGKNGPEIVATKTRIMKLANGADEEVECILDIPNFSSSEKYTVKVFVWDVDGGISPYYSKTF